MRLFFALALDHDTRERLAGIAERLRAWDLPARWVHPDDYHITLLFCGEVPEHEAGFLEYAAEDVASHALRPELRLPGLGAFAGKQAPRIVYAAVQDTQDACGNLHRDLADACAADVEPHYLPHVTLCRPDQRGDVDPARWRAVFEAQGLAHWGPCGVEEVVLYQSGGSRFGATRYQALKRWELLA